MDGSVNPGVRPAVPRDLPAVLRPGLISDATPAVEYVVVIAPTTAQLFLPSNTNRIGFYLLRSPTAAGPIFISTFSDPTAAGVRIDGPGGFASVTADVWFSLTQRGWYVYSTPGETVVVYELVKVW